MTKKQGLRAVVFLMVLAAVFMALSFVLRYRSVRTDERYNTFYNLEKNTIDAVYIGASGVDRFWMAPKAWNDYGIAVYPMSTDAQPIAAANGIIREVQKTQDPKIIIIDVRNLKRDLKELNSGAIYQAFTSIRSPLNRMKTTKEILDFAGKDSSERAAYYLPILKFHSRWSTGLKENDFTRKESDLLGSFYQKKASYKVKNIVDITPVTSEEGPFLEGMEAALRNVLEFCKENKLNALFVVSPFAITTQERKMFNSAGKVIGEYGYPFLNFNDRYEELGLDFTKDFYDEGHTNLYGAIKYTDYFSRYLVSEYQLENKRGKPGYSKWDKAYRTMKKKVSKDSDTLRLE